MIPLEQGPDNAPRSQAEQDIERMRRFAQAIDADEQYDAQACRHVQQMLPRLAEAELRGERISRLFRAEVTHMDGCEECSLAYGELLDALISLEESVGIMQPILPPSLPARLRLVMRLRGWVLRVAGDMVGALSLADSSDFEAAAYALLERLPELPQVLTPHQSRQLALGWGADADAALMLVACWDATEHIVGRYSSQQMQEMADAGLLLDVARDVAADTARRLKLGTLRARFVEMYVADVRANPSALAALARLDD